MTKIRKNKTNDSTEKSIQIESRPHRKLGHAKPKTPHATHETHAGDLLSRIGLGRVNGVAESRIAFVGRVEIRVRRRAERHGR